MPTKSRDDESRYTFLPIAEAVIPPGGLIEHIKNSWWVVHPDKGLLFFRGHSPQCNGNKSIVERLKPEWAEILFIPSVFRRINPSDYA